MSDLIHEFIFTSARRTPAAEALVYGQRRLDYAALADAVGQVASGLLAAGLGRGERVAVYLEKNVENVAAMFGAAAAGGVFVPVNPLLKPEQVAYILADCNVRVLVTSADRLSLLAPALAAVPRPADWWSSPAPADSAGAGRRRRRAAAGTPSSPPPAPRARAHRVHRRRHGRHPVHLRQHRQAEGRGAVAPQHGGRRHQRRQLPGEHRRPTASWRCCRSASTTA